MSGDVRGMDRVRTPAVGKLRTGELEAKLVRAGLKIDESFEVGAANWPANRREVVVESRNGDGSIECLLRRIGNRSIDDENLLIDL